VYDVCAWEETDSRVVLFLTKFNESRRQLEGGWGEEGWDAGSEVLLEPV